MPYSGDTYMEISSGAYDLQDRLKDFKNSLDFAAAQPGQIVSALTAFGVEKGPLVTAANALAAADPEDGSKQVLAEHVNNLVEDYNALSTRAQTMATAIENL